MNRLFGTPAKWEGAILQGAQEWAAATNVNFAVVSDNGAQIGQGPDQQGDPNMGDIRIGGYYISQGFLGQASMPPPANNFSIAGDIQFNTAASWKIGSSHGTYDLSTVAAHEIGHALGLYHGTTTSDVMYGTYNGVKNSLAPDDVAGIQAIYSGGSGRSQDGYNSGGASNGTLATAANLTSLLDPGTQTALIQNLEVDAPTQAEYFTVTAPTGTSSNLAVTVQSTGLSLFTPAVTVYAADGSTVLGTQTAAGSLNGGTLTVNVSGVTPGTQYYIKVTGADSSVFSTGTYAMTLNFGTGAAPTVPLPNTTLANGNPLQGGGAQAELPPWLTPALLARAEAATGLTQQAIISNILNQGDSLGVNTRADSYFTRLVKHDGNVGDTTTPSTTQVGTSTNSSQAQLTAAYFATAAGGHHHG